MAYNIRSLEMVSIGKKKYFFDANLWIRILKPQLNLTSRDRKYVDFFEKFRSHPTHPHIALTALVLSEIINRYLHDVTYTKYWKKTCSELPAKTYYKEVYRASHQFNTDYISLCEDIKSYQNMYELVSDGLGAEIRQKDLLTSPPQGLDFNDHYYYQMAKHYGFTIVTDDKDFFVEDVEVLTLNNSLIDRANASLSINK